MPVGLLPPVKLLPVPGVRLATCSAQIYPKKRDDVVLMAFDGELAVSAVFTSNAFAAAPVTVARDHLRKAASKFCLINAGNANAGTGERGIVNTLETCSRLAELAGCETTQVLPFSTGVIGQDLPFEKICRVLPELYNNLEDDYWIQAANAIMTTDTVAKGISREVIINNSTVTITGIAKGAGMIRPDMATMLAFIATDASVGRNLLDKMLTDSVNQSFNRICIDGDTSTNDACVLIATGRSDSGAITESGSESHKQLQVTLDEICISLAQSIVRDAEGITKFITVSVEKGADTGECLTVAYSIATSPLVKTAFFASDPNWGRILAAVGRAGLENLDVSRISIYLNGTAIVTAGTRDRHYTEESGMEVMSQHEIEVRVVLNRGTASEKIWTSDLSHDYVRINAEYRS